MQQQRGEKAFKVPHFRHPLQCEGRLLLSAEQFLYYQLSHRLTGIVYQTILLNIISTAF